MSIRMQFSISDACLLKDSLSLAIQEVANKQVTFTNCEEQLDQLQRLKALEDNLDTLYLRVLQRISNAQAAQRDATSREGNQYDFTHLGQ